MARRKRGSSSEQPIGVGFTAKQMKRKKPLNQGYLIDIEPLSDNQKRLFESYDQEKDSGLRFKKLCETLKDITTWSEYKWQSLWPLVVEIAKHNHHNFESHHSRSRINIKKAKKVIFNL